jgi:hypothetical protein
MVVASSSRYLETIDFGEYCEKVRRWAAEQLNIIPDQSRFQPKIKVLGGGDDISMVACCADSGSDFLAYLDIKNMVIDLFN